MKLAIVGSRSFNNYEKAKKIFVERFKDVTHIVSGGARGGDLIGKQIANEFGLEYIEFLADWKKYGRSAGFQRNPFIVKSCDEVLAFWDGISGGTKNTLDIAKRSKKNSTIIYFNPLDSYLS